jgi:acyl dehydratase
MTAQSVVLGDEHDVAFHAITREWVQAYIAAVGGVWEGVVADGERAPPTALSVLSFKACEATYEMYAGRIQISQELRFFAPLLIGSTVVITSRVLDKYERRGRTVAVFETTFLDDRGACIARGISHVILPDEPEAA